MRRLVDNVGADPLSALFSQPPREVMLAALHALLVEAPTYDPKQLGPIRAMPWASGLTQHWNESVMRAGLGVRVGPAYNGGPEFWRVDLEGVKAAIERLESEET